MSCSGWGSIDTPWGGPPDPRRRRQRSRLAGTIATPILFLAVSAAAPLPDRYYELLEAGSKQVAGRLNADPGATLESLEKTPSWRHFGYSVLAPAVLYARRGHDPAMLALAMRIGDLLASENERGKFTPRLDSDWDTYIWLEAFRLLQADLGVERRERWKKAILENAAPLAAPAAERMDFPWYNSPYIGTSPNHYAQWAELLYLAGATFDKPEWVKSGSSILHRFVAGEQTPDGYWGEHSRAGPTTNYDYVTLSAVGVYWEHTHDPAALEALRRSTDFHTHFTYPDGTPVETINDRNRYGGVEPWAQFAFTNFPQGRRYAEFLTGFFSPDKLSMDALGRLAQDALYYHAGPSEPIPQDRANYVYRLGIPAAIRKTGLWVVCLSGIVDTQAATNQFYLDRQSEVSVFHSRLGLIVNGANSKRQPELATFRERVAGVTYYMPLSSRLQTGEQTDRLSVAFNTFFSDLYAVRPTEREMTLRFMISGKGRPPEEAFTTLQLVLQPGEALETAAGKKMTVGGERIDLSPDAIGAWIRHHGWTMYVDPAARLVWPVYPFNPYSNAPEEGLAHAVAALSVPLKLQSKQGHPVRPNEQEILFRLATE
jgi:hypothetical protein